MKILRIGDIPNNRYGGVSRTMHLTGDELQRMGHEVRYLFRDDLQIFGHPKLRRFTVPWAIPNQVAAIHQQWPIDIVEVHEPLAAVYAFRRRCGAALPPLVIFSYGLEERGYRADYRYRRLKSLPIGLKFRISPHTQLAQSKYAVRKADHVICSNQEDVDYLQSKGISPHRLTRHHSGVTDSFLKATAPLLASPGRGVLFMASWIYRKGTLEVATAVTALLRKHPEAVFTAAGTGVPDSVVYNAFPTDLRDRIRVVSAMRSEADLIDVLKQNHILLLPSYYEGQPLVMIEAAAAGLAIVTTDICGMKDFIQDNVNGRLVPVGDSEKIAQVLQQLWDDPAMCRTLGQAARRTAEEHTWTNASKRILAAYEKVLAR